MTYLIVIGIGDDPNPCNRKIFLDIDADDPMKAQELGLAEARRREPERKKFYVDRCIAPLKNANPDSIVPAPDPLKEARAEGYLAAAKMVAAKSDLIRGTRGSVKRACMELDLTCRDLEDAAAKARE